MAKRNLESNRQLGLDFVTGLAGSGVQTDDLIIKKRKIIGEINVDGPDGYEGDFVIKTSKKGFVKSIDMVLEYPGGFRAEIDWDDLNYRKANRSLKSLKYINEFATGTRYMESADFQSGIDTWESIPGMGDMTITLHWSGEKLIFD